ncbi:MAG TPA: hypothetical protein PLC04_01600 [Candidatus Kapabacteria bacterium]|jgi:ABC-type uncharacterized transport system auxiliary subunit|nr:hypothetical protein [Candidatus Kapabacteria bacterium]HOV91759.1 hypothetical protein [Candidatus Kapabacteria bacterium]
MSSCINIKSDYPEITYYELTAPKVEPTKVKVQNTLMVREFKAPYISSPRIFMVEKPSGEFEKLFYYRWANDFDILFNGVLLNYLSKSEAFVGGVVSSNSSLIPSYVLEGEILDLKIYNDNEKNKSFAELSVKVNLLGYTPNDSVQFQLFYTNLYTKKITRANNTPETIATAVNTAVNDICSEMLTDILDAIQKREKGSN